MKVLPSASRKMAGALKSSGAPSRPRRAPAIQVFSTSGSTWSNWSVIAVLIYLRWSAKVEFQRKKYYLHLVKVYWPWCRTGPIPEQASDTFVAPQTCLCYMLRMWDPDPINSCSNHYNRVYILYSQFDRTLRQSSLYLIGFCSPPLF